MSAPPPVPELKPSSPSKFWKSYVGMVNGKSNPFEKKKTTPPKESMTSTTIPYYISKSLRKSSTFKGNPDKDILRSAYLLAADKYMSQCITKQYKMTAAPYGTYNMQCTEGTIRGQANYARNLSLSASFRMTQRSVSQKFADYTETRRKAIIGAHGCSYEENLLTTFPSSARSYILAGAEAKSSCSRYATESSTEETYMAASVTKQYMMQKTPNGIYGLNCSDGNQKGLAEYKRVQALAAQFRAGQQPLLAQERIKFDSRKYARDYYGHLCSYEEKLFNKYPMVSASMRPSTSY